MTDEARGGAGRAIGWAGLTCGVMDITAAFVTWAPKGIMPKRILQGVASGLLGQSSFSGGWASAALGLCCHFFIAFSAATVFYLASRKIAWLLERPFISGPLYGIAVYGVMYWVVVPLSAAAHRTPTWSGTIIAIITHIICVGSPIAIVEGRVLRRGADRAAVTA